MAEKSEPMPVLLCGQHAQIAASVVAGLLPKYEVIHACLSLDEALRDLPFLTHGVAPSPIDPSNPGTKNYGRVPRAVVLGVTYNSQLSALIEACNAYDGAGADTSKEGRTVWVIMDTKQPAPPLGAEFAKAMMQRTQVALEKLASGEAEVNEEGVTLY